MADIGIGLLGLGNVGSGLVAGIQQSGALIADRSDVRLHIRKIAVRDPGKPRSVEVDPSLLTTDAMAVVRDPSVDVVVETIGVVADARALVLAALDAGKPVVTANKALLAEHGDELFAASESSNVDLYFESSVGGGIPIIRALREGLIGNHIHSIHGILNGTCNYILTRMEDEQLGLDTVLREAQEAGYAEPEPSLDIDGWDTAHKAVILAALAYGFTTQLDEVDVEGIREVALEDLRMARQMGYTLKLLAAIQDTELGISVRVQPTLIPLHTMLASVRGVFNAVAVDGDIVGETLYYGRGAGAAPTASAILSDLVDVGRNLVAGSAHRVPAMARHHQYERIRDPAALAARYYLRISIRNAPGKLARIAEILGEHGISIASVHQQEETYDDQFANVAIVTHASREGRFRDALAVIDGLADVDRPTVRYRIEDFGAPPGRAR